MTSLRVAMATVVFVATMVFEFCVIGRGSSQPFQHSFFPFSIASTGSTVRYDSPCEPNFTQTGNNQIQSVGVHTSCNMKECITEVGKCGASAHQPESFHKQIISSDDTSTSLRNQVKTVTNDTTVDMNASIVNQTRRLHKVLAVVKTRMKPSVRVNQRFHNNRAVPKRLLRDSVKIRLG